MNSNLKQIVNDIDSNNNIIKTEADVASQQIITLTDPIENLYCRYNFTKSGLQIMLFEINISWSLLNHIVRLTVGDSKWR